LLMTEASSRLTIGLLGSFRLVAPNGERIEIASKKAMALIAMLATADSGERTRSWLCDKLWGTRDLPQARSSLRRELSNLRKALKDSAPLLLCTNDRVGLDMEKVCLETGGIEAGGTRLSDSFGVGSDFLEGLDLPGEEGFEDWLRQQRAALTARREALEQTRVSRGPGQIAAAGRSSPDFLSLPPGIIDVSRPPLGFNGKPALAVLPFANLTGDPANEYLSDGISEELIDRVSRLRWLPVISRGSSFSIVNEKLDRKLISQRLGAKYLLEGRLRLVAGTFSLSTSLEDAASGHTLFSQRMAVPSPHSQDSLEQLVAGLVAVLGTRIDLAEQVGARSRQKDDLNVNDLIWRGRWHLNRFTRADAQTARHLFEEALRLDPDSSEALIQTTFCAALSIWAGRQPDSQISQMRKLAQRAILADVEDGRGHMLAGMAEMWLRNPLRAQTLLRKAIELNPSLALAHAELGSSSIFAGEPAAAIEQLRTAMRLSPSDIHVFYPLGELAMANCILGRWSDAIELADQAIIRRPSYWYAQMIKIKALVATGNIPMAASCFNELIAAKPKFSQKYIQWLPFVDQKWNDYFNQGLMQASANRFAQLDSTGESVFV